MVRMVGTMHHGAFKEVECEHALCRLSYASSHIGSVASTYTSMRIAGAVKDSLVDLVCEELDRLVPLWKLRPSITMRSERHWMMHNEPG